MLTSNAVKHHMEQGNTIMKLSKSLLAILAAIAAIGLISSAQAVPITGLLNIGGSATFDTTSLATTTRVTAFGSDVATGSGNTGSFSAIPASVPVSMAGTYIFNPSTPTPALWSVTFGGSTFTFNLSSSSIVLQNANFLNVRGTGTILGTGFDPTPGVWNFTSQDAAGGLAVPATMTFTFSANTAALGVPDSGMTVALLGISLIGVAALRARFAKS